MLALWKCKNYNQALLGLFACSSSFFTGVSGLINTAVFQSDFGFSVGSLRATTLVTTLPTQFVDGMQRCCFFKRPGAWWLQSQKVSHANISLAGVSGVKKRCQTLGTRTKKNRLSDALILLYLNRNPFGLISHCSKLPFYVQNVAWFRTF